MEYKTLGLNAVGFYNTQSWKPDENLGGFVPNRAREEGERPPLRSHNSPAALRTKSSNNIPQRSHSFSPSMSKTMEYDITIHLLQAPRTRCLSGVPQRWGTGGFTGCNKCHPSVMGEEPTPPGAAPAAAQPSWVNSQSRLRSSNLP